MVYDFGQCLHSIHLFKYFTYVVLNGAWCPFIFGLCLSKGRVPNYWWLEERQRLLMINCQKKKSKHLATFSNWGYPENTHTRSSWDNHFSYFSSLLGGWALDGWLWESNRREEFVSCLANPTAPGKGKKQEVAWAMPRVRVSIYYICRNSFWHILCLTCVYLYVGIL